MFGSRSAKKAAASQKSITPRAGKGATLIADTTRITGDLHFSDQLFVNGRVEGNISADPNTDATMVLSDVGHVKGQIRAPYVIINGEVDGDVYAGTRVELAANARVSGNVYYSLIEMQLGAMVDGQLVHVSPEEASTQPASDGAAAPDEPAQVRALAASDAAESTDSSEDVEVPDKTDNELSRKSGS